MALATRCHYRLCLPRPPRVSIDVKRLQRGLRSAGFAGTQCGADRHLTASDVPQVFVLADGRQELKAGRAAHQKLLATPGGRNPIDHHVEQ